jgi:hypothetical protein
MKFTPHPQLILKFIMSRDILLLPPYTFTAWAQENVLFYLYIDLVIITY